jgi:hypothetical protein
MGGMGDGFECVTKCYDCFAGEEGYDGLKLIGLVVRKED